MVVGTEAFYADKPDFNFNGKKKGASLFLPLSFFKSNCSVAISHKKFTNPLDTKKLTIFVCERLLCLCNDISGNSTTYIRNEHCDNVK